MLASRTLPRRQKRAVILQALARYRDSTSFTTTREEWRTMSREMGAVDTAVVADVPTGCR